MDALCNVDDSDVSLDGNIAKNSILMHSATSLDGAHDNAGQYPKQSMDYVIID